MKKQSQELSRLYRDLFYKRKNAEKHPDALFAQYQCDQIRKRERRERGVRR